MQTAKMTKEGGEKIHLGKQKGLSMVGASQWEAIMRKYHEAHKETCKVFPKEIPRVPRSKKVFPTGSTYEGDWTVFGFSGKGKYTFPGKGDIPQVTYEGEFDDGLFNGEGEQKYECGATIQGTWKKGALVEKKLMFSDGLEYEENNWHYCHVPDRRFTVEYENGLKAAGQSILTADQPTKEIPPGLYDTGDGFYCPKTKNVYKYHDLTAITRSPAVREQQWILQNCRVTPLDQIGPCPFLYEEWLEPTLEAEDPPPPAAKTKTYRKELEDLETYFSHPQTCGPFTGRQSMARVGVLPFYTNPDYENQEQNLSRRSSRLKLEGTSSTKGMLPTFTLSKPIFHRSTTS